MRRSGQGSGGGLGMNKSKNVGYRTGVGARAVDPVFAQQQGQSLGSHATETGRNLPYRPAGVYKPPNFRPVELGNAVALNVGSGGPGKGRNIYGRGMQGVHGQPNPGRSPERRDTLAEFGNDSVTARGRR